MGTWPMGFALLKFARAAADETESNEKVFGGHDAIRAQENFSKIIIRVFAVP